MGKISWCHPDLLSAPLSGGAEGDDRPRGSYEAAWAAEVKVREARRCAEDREAARKFAELEAQLKGADGRANKAEAKADALAAEKLQY